MGSNAVQEGLICAVERVEEGMEVLLEDPGEEGDEGSIEGRWWSGWKGKLCSGRCWSKSRCFALGFCQIYAAQSVLVGQQNPFVPNIQGRYVLLADQNKVYDNQLTII